MPEVKNIGGKVSDDTAELRDGLARVQNQVQSKSQSIEDAYEILDNYLSLIQNIERQLIEHGDRHNLLQNSVRTQGTNISQVYRDSTEEGAKLHLRIDGLGVSLDRLNESLIAAKRTLTEDIDRLNKSLSSTKVSTSQLQDSLRILRGHHNDLGRLVNSLSACVSDSFRFDVFNLILIMCLCLALAWVAYQG